MISGLRLSYAAFFLGFFLAGQAQAGKFDASFGYFSLQASTSRASGTASNPGSYSLGYRHEVLPSLELGIGYSVILTGIIGGDVSYGLDVGVNYFPLTLAGRTYWASDTAQFAMTELFRPFVGISFHQRQFQSISTGYAGLGLRVGAERSLTQSFSVRAEGRYLMLAGPSDARATQMDILAGVSFLF